MPIARLTDQMTNTSRFVLCLALLTMGVSAAQLCQRWGEPETAGQLDTALLPEASGIALSRIFANRLYHINDSGHGPYFYITDPMGQNTRQVRVEGLSAIDPEDLSMGPCAGDQSCLFIGDIGDNLAVRDTTEVAVLIEEDFGASAVPYRLVTLRYPDGPRDAESLAVHPNGDMYILSKEWRRFPLLADPARLYRLSREAWEDHPEERHTLEFVATLDLPALNRGQTTPLGFVATGMDIAPTGDRFIVLTYQNALEFAVDLSLGWPSQLTPGESYQTIPLQILPQQEAVSYLEDGRSFIYSSEVRPPFNEAELIRVTCLD
jgi:hypothetical protein